MYILAKTKFGNCDICPKKNTQIVKVGKICYCLSKCYRELKQQQQITKSNKRDNARRQSQSTNKYIFPSLNTKIRGLVDKGDNKTLNSLDAWFKERRKEMTGRCKHCNNTSCKNDDKYFKFSICHILPKAYFPSVATHEMNFIELCFWKNNCHGNMDNKILDLTEMNCWDEIVTKFCIIYPSIAKEERRRIPEMLLQYAEVEK